MWPSNSNNLTSGQMRLTFLLATTAALHLSTASAQNTNVTAEDPRINYVGTWIVQDEGGHEFTNTRGSSLSFTFQGSAIFWYSARDPKGGVANVVVDSGTPLAIDASSETALNDDAFEAVLFNQTGLDFTKAHTLNISYIGPGSIGGPYVTIYMLAFTPPGNLIPIIPIPPSSAESPASSVSAAEAQSSTSFSNDALTAALRSAQRTNIILGAVLGTIVGFLLLSTTILLLIVLLRKRRSIRSRFGEASPFFASGISSTPPGSGLGIPVRTKIPSATLRNLEASPRHIERLPISTVNGSPYNVIAHSSPPLYSI